MLAATATELTPPEHVWFHIRSRLADGPISFLDCSGSHGLDGGVRAGADLLALSDWVTARLQIGPRPALVVLAFGRSHAFLPVFWACLRLGLPALPLALPASFAEQRREAKRIASAYGSALFIYDEDGAAFVEAIARQSSPELRRLSFSDLVTAAAGADPRLEAHQFNPRAPAYLLETSGTTGSPRAACFSGQSQAADLSDLAILWLFPLSSSSGISGAFALHRLTAFLPLRDAIRDPDRLLALIEHHRITGFAMPPVLLSALLRHLREPSGPLQRRDLSSLTRVNIGSAASSPADIAALQELLADWGLASGVIHTGYGLTETGIVAWGPFLKDDALALPPGETLIGPLYDKVETRVVEEDVLQVRKPFSFLGYLQQPCVTNTGALALETFESGIDWFDTGDRARLEPGLDGGVPRLVLKGRAKDILVVNSRKLSLPAIEQVLQQRFPQLLVQVSACVMPPDRGGANERLLLVLAPAAALARQAALPDDLMQELEQQIQSVLQDQFGIVAVSIRLLAAADFPRTSTGKVRKRDLVEWVLGEVVDSAAARHQENLAKPEALPVIPSLPTALEQSLLAWIRRHAPLHQAIDRRQKLSAFGIDSLAFAGLIGELERQHGCRCRLERCPQDPSIADLVSLFDGYGQEEASVAVASAEVPIVDSRNPGQVFLRHSYEQLLRAANLQSNGRVIGVGGIARLHNPEATGRPLVLVSAWPTPVVQLIADRLPGNPVCSLRVAHDFLTPANHQYLLFCYLEWIESCLSLLGSPYILVGNCRAAMIALELAQLLRPRQLEPWLTVLLQWDPRLMREPRAAYGGQVAYHIHSDHHGGDPGRSQDLLGSLREMTPVIQQVIFSGTSYNAESAYPTGRQPYDALIRLVEQLSA